MSSTTQLIEDAIEASKRAVHFDQAGQQEAAASYFYKVAAQLLEKASSIDSDNSTTWLSKAETYRNRAHNLDAIEQCHQKRDVIEAGAKQQLERCHFLLQQGLDADESGAKETAIELYTQAVEVAIHHKCNDPIMSDKLKKIALQALERAEQLKGIENVRNPEFITPSVAHSSTRSRPQLHRGSSAHLKVTGSTETYTLEEKKVLLHTSRINQNEFVPFMDIDLSERFQYAIPFSDKDGLLQLSPKQKREFHRWIRPEDICQDPCIILGEHPDYYSIKQTIVSDCSFVASLAVSASYERRFGKRLVTSIIYPRARDKPIYNPFGKYMVKLHVNGVTRKVIIDDQLPFGKYGQLLCSYSSNKNELWISLLEKAYMKVMGGYDFPGSNSNIDLHALTGWIPERVAIRETDKDFNRDALFSTLETRMSKGDVLVTVATGNFTDLEAERTGLVSTHAYAVMDVKTVRGGVRLLKLKNPWSHLRWRGNYSELDTKHWTEDLKTALAYDPDSAAQFDNGVFWIDYDSICKFYDVFYLNWNPGLFHYTYCIHQEWNAGSGPIKDAYNIGSNPQFTLDVNDDSSGAVWILLTRHITDIADFRDNKVYVTVLVYKGNGRRIYYPNDPSPFIDGVRINSPHYLCKIILKPDSSRRYTLVVSQYEKTQTIYYTLRAYATCPFRFNKISNPYLHEKKVNDAWTEKTAGGCGNHVLTYKINPRYRLNLDSVHNNNYLFIELRGPKHYEVGFAVSIVSINDSDITAPFHTQTTRPYRSGFVIMELENIPAGTLHVIPSTFNPGQQGPYILTIKSSASIQLTREQ